eukprot:CAMPEP_0170511708 /NCGR_PEP_ID=MMETSP0208-20121228/66451_1 /TAXON_ID=197538 /ORGANISM="Strombidium inclinatum, Strain S3" /LENGTH=88 /DNA_ID=CAMNT_0010795271 /DNA_START=315 /DNA_END=581 /DNA_ORIENTATION=+
MAKELHLVVALKSEVEDDCADEAVGGHVRCLDLLQRPVDGDLRDGRKHRDDYYRGELLAGVKLLPPKQKCRRLQYDKREYAHEEAHDS